MISKLAILAVPFLYALPTIAAIPTAYLDIYTSNTTTCDFFEPHVSFQLNENECHDFGNITGESVGFNRLANAEDVVSLGCFGVVYEYPGCTGGTSIMRDPGTGYTAAIQSPLESLTCASGSFFWSDGQGNVSSALFTCLNPTTPSC